MRLLVVRPQPGADATAARLRAMGHLPHVEPLLRAQAMAWAPPPGPFDAIVLSSAAAARLAGPAADPLRQHRVLAVGSATAAAARAAGWADVHEGPGTLQALLDAAGPHRRLLHLAGADRTSVAVPAAVMLNVVTVYRAVVLPLPAVPAVAGVLLHSPRTARHLAAEWARLGGGRGDVQVFALSPAVAAAAGGGWQAVAVAAHPREEALLALLPKAG
jgi:uroporphyrinogen-III synthase